MVQYGELFRPETCTKCYLAHQVPQIKVICLTLVTLLRNLVFCLINVIIQTNTWLKWWTPFLSYRVSACWRELHIAHYALYITLSLAWCEFVLTTSFLVTLTLQYNKLYEKLLLEKLCLNIMWIYICSQNHNCLY